MQEKLEKSEEEYKKNLQHIENQKYELRLKEMDILRHEKMLVLLILIHLSYLCILLKHKAIFWIVHLKFYCANMHDFVSYVCVLCVYSIYVKKEPMWQPFFVDDG